MGLSARQRIGFSELRKREIFDEGGFEQEGNFFPVVLLNKERLIDGFAVGVDGGDFDLGHVPLLELEKGSEEAEMKG